MPNPDFVIKMDDTLEPITAFARKRDGVTPIDEDLSTATCKFTLRTWAGVVLLDHVDAVIADINTKKLGCDLEPHMASLVPSGRFYHHLGWFTLHIASDLLSVPNDNYLYVRVSP